MHSRLKLIDTGKRENVMRGIDTTGLTDKQIEFLIEQVRKDRAANIETQIEKQKEEKKALARHAKSDCVKYYGIRREIINVELPKYLKGTDLGNAIKSGHITAEKAFIKLVKMPAREPITDGGWVRRHAEITRREKRAGRKPAVKRALTKVRPPGKQPLRPS